MRDAATLQRELLDLAEAALLRPALVSVSALPALEEELAALRPKATDPAGGLLIDDETLLLAQALRMQARQRAAHDDRRAALMLQIVGVLLPAVRAAHWRAIEVRRDTRATP